MAKTYEEFEGLLCAQVQDAAGKLHSVSSRAQKIELLSELMTTCSLLKEWLDIGEPQHSDNTEAYYAPESEDAYEELPKKPKEVY